MRKNIIAGNWKMNCTLPEGKKLASEVIQMVKDQVFSDTEVVLIPSYIHLTSIHSLIGSSKNVFLGSQDCHENKEGAYTGEVSASMLVSAGVNYVVLGHSERREYFNESDELVGKKIAFTLSNKLIPIFCCGENLASREAEDHEQVVGQQLEVALFGLKEEEIRQVVIAYEPVWAIGTGKTATAEQAQTMHTYIRSQILKRYSQEIANSISIIYGGSVKPENAKKLFAQPDIDGGLIGGASLKTKDFLAIIKAFE